MGSRSLGGEQRVPEQQEKNLHGVYELMRPHRLP
jgi:hypothetical protein